MSFVCSEDMNALEKYENKFLAKEKAVHKRRRGVSAPSKSSATETEVERALGKRPQVPSSLSKAGNTTKSGRKAQRGAQQSSLNCVDSKIILESKTKKGNLSEVFSEGEGGDEGVCDDVQVSHDDLTKASSPYWTASEAAPVQFVVF